MEINHITLPTAIIWENYPFRMFGTKHTLCRGAEGMNYMTTTKFLYQEGNQGFDVGTEHFFSYFAQMHYETFDKAYFPYQRHISTSVLCTLYG